MKLQMAIPLVLGALTLAPAAVLASQNQVREHAFTTEGRALALSRRVGLAGREATTPETVTVVPVNIVGTRPRGAQAAHRATETRCEDWRALQSGPNARAAGAPLVRACDGGVEPGSAAAPNVPSRQAIAAARPRAHYDFLVDLAAPR